MIRSIVFSLLFVCAPAAVAMDSTEAAPVPAPEKENPAIEMSIADSPHYMGTCERREKIEKIYGHSFPLNTVFISIRLIGREFRREHSGLIPDLIPYEYIYAMHEGESLELSINGKKHIVQCKQQREENYYEKERFENLLSFLVKNFTGSANCYCDGEESLLREHIIDRNTETGHGKNGSPSGPLMPISFTFRNVKQ